MSRRFINCTACKGCHTGRGGQFCKFSSPQQKSPSVKVTGTMAMADVPDRNSPDYADYLADQIEEEESRLKLLKEKCRVTTMEEQLANLRLESAKLQTASTMRSAAGVGSTASDDETGIAAGLLAASKGLSPGGSLGRSRSSSRPPRGAHTAHTVKSTFMQRPKEDKEMLCKLKPMSHLAEPKAPEKVTYRELICAMTSVLKLIAECGMDTTNYISHVNFIAHKASLNLYAMDALVKYEAAVTERVISGIYEDWVTADPECVALHLGADATYAVRQGGSRWARQSSGNFATNRDFADWPKEICWLYNNTSCYFQRCKKAHICVKCKKTGHTSRECKSSDDASGVSAPEVTSPKSQKETRKV